MKNINPAGVPVKAGMPAHEGVELIMDEMNLPQMYLHFPQSKNNVLLEDDITIAGRSPKTADIALASYFEKGDISQISRKHFKITQDQRRKIFTITDSESANGTELNGEALAKYKPATLRHGDLIKLAGDDHLLIKVIIDNGPTNKPRPIAGIYFDDARSQFMVDNRPMSDDHLVSNEEELLRYLYEKTGQVCSRDELVEMVFLGAEVGDHAVAKRISNLRKKLDKVSPGARHYIKTIIKQGYQLQKAK